jgi:hypothetical protein
MRHRAAEGRLAAGRTRTLDAPRGYRAAPSEVTHARRIDANASLATPPRPQAPRLKSPSPGRARQRAVPVPAAVPWRRGCWAVDPRLPACGCESSRRLSLFWANVSPGEQGGAVSRVGAVGPGLVTVSGHRLWRLEWSLARRRARSGPGTPASVAPGPARGSSAAERAVLRSIRHVVVLMMENHSFDNYFGFLEGVDGHRGNARNPNRAENGEIVPALQLRSTKQYPQLPTQSWYASHLQYGEGRCDGFVRSPRRSRAGRTSSPRARSSRLRR